MGTPAFNPNGAYSAPSFDPSAPYDAGGSAAHHYDYSNLTANPKGEGTYKMTSPDGQTLNVPYSNVPVFQGLIGHPFASTGEQQRFEKDAAADPNKPSWWGTLTGGMLQGNAPWQKAVDTAAQTEPYSADKGVGGNAKAAGNNLAAAAAVFAEPIAHPVKTVEAMLPSIPTRDGGSISAAGYTPPPATKPTWGEVGGQATAMAPGVALMAASGATPTEIVEAPGKTVINSAQATSDFLNSRMKTAIAGDVNAPIPGTDVTPAARYQSMKDMGLQPNAAEATNSTPLRVAQRLNENSLSSSHLYSDAQANNLKALEGYTEHVLNEMGPSDPVEGGAAVQRGLRAHQVALQNQAAQGFDELDQATGHRMLQGQTIQQTAKNIYDANANYFEKHPSLVPTNAWKLVKDLAGADNNFQSRPMSFGEVHQLRSDLLEMVRSNPDIVKNQAGGWLQQLADAADQTMTTGAGGLNPQGVQIFRDANKAWADMKSTYDNPQSQLYHAVRSQSPSQLLNGIVRTPEMAETLQNALGPDGIGPIQRGVVEKLLGATKEGGYNFKNFQRQWNGLSDRYKAALFTPDQIQQLDGIGNAGTVLNADVNPSGSAKLGMKMGEMAQAGNALAHPAELPYTAAYHAAQWGLGKLMNSPRFVDWLMRDTGTTPAAPAAVPGRLIPAAVASGVMSSGWDWENNRPKE